jgi:hypothetical protein
VRFARTDPSGFGRSDGYDAIVDTFFKRVTNVTFDEAAENVGLPADGLSRSHRFEMSLPIRFGGMGVRGHGCLS